MSEHNGRCTPSRPDGETPAGAGESEGHGPVSLHAEGAIDVRRMGGKAARLAILARAGLPVPPGFCLPADWCWEWVGAERGNGGHGAPGQAREEASADGRTKALLETCARMAGQRAGTLWAVRSSAAEEDGRASSFAGQGDTFLRVPTPRVPDRVRDCWLSLWSDRAVAYREAWGGRPAMAVLVQRMVDATAAGVAFSRDPISGEPAVVVEVVSGTAENLMEGTLSPRRLVVTSNEAVAEGDADGLLSREQIRELADLVGRIEKVLGWPVDVEWALADGRFAILQARPLTAVGHDRFYGPAEDDDDLWTSAFVDERFPGPVSPLGWTLIREPFERLALREPLAFIGDPEARVRPVTKLHHGRPYLSVGAMASLYKLLPDAVLPEDAARYFPGGRIGLRGRASYPRSWLDRRLWPAILATAVKELSGWSPFHNHRHWARRRVEYLAKVEEAERALMGDPSPLQLLDWAERLRGADDLLLSVHRWSLTHAELWYSLLRRLAKRWLGDGWESRVEVLVRGAEAVSIGLDGELRDLADQVAEHTDLTVPLAEASSLAELRSRLPDSAVGREFGRKMEAFLAEYGHRSFSLDLHFPPFAEQPRQVFDLVRSMARTAPRAASLGGPGGPAGPDGWRRLPFALALAAARRYLGLREEQRLYWQRGLAARRRIYLRLGDYLAAEGGLARPDDIFFLTVEEVAEAVRGQLGRPATRRTAARRRREHAVLLAAHAEDPWGTYPRFVRGNQLLAADRCIARETMRGIPVSAGRAMGRARVVNGAHDLTTVGEGEVLVAPSVDPGWTPVFGRIAGLITERGGQLSHPAVVAREYGLPAVLGVPAVCRHVRTGDLLLVDGTAGTVTNLSSSPGASPSPAGIASDDLA